MSIAEFSQALRNKALKSWLIQDPKSQESNLTDKQLDAAVSYYKEATIDLYAKADKAVSTSGNVKYIVEIIPTLADKYSSLLKVFDPKLTQLKDVVYNVQQSLKDPEYVRDLLNLRSSPSILEMISKQIRDTLAGRATNQTFSTPNTKIASKKPNKPKNFNKPVRNIQGQFYSLASLKVLLDTHIQDVVSANMGDQPYKGGQRKILNYDTGRFAASVKVERLSLSKEGMITAFYDYMKYPYATFSKGGVQSTPSSRDPKLLISKSISEIATTKVSNRLRSVLI